VRDCDEKKYASKIEILNVRGLNVGVRRFFLSLEVDDINALALCLGIGKRLASDVTFGQWRRLP
jgi:hypothetical protein